MFFQKIVIKYYIMKKNASIILFLISNLIFSQNCKNSLYTTDLTKIKEKDTVYIYFKQSKLESCTEKVNNRKTGNPNFMQIYTVGTDLHNSIKFFYSDYIDVEHYEKNEKSDVKIVKKSFLKKNKENIIDINFFIVNGYRESFYHLIRKKIYLIDKSEIKNKKIILKEVQMNILKSE